MTYYIYCITNNLNNKSYVGQSIDAKERWKDHIYDAKRTVGKTAITKKFAIQNAILKYGEIGFTWQIIDQLETIDEANETEEFYIAYLQTLAPNGYNLHPGGRNKRQSEETKQKIREKLKIVGSVVGKSGKGHPNFGTKRSAKDRLAQSLRLSGDKSSGKKIDSKIARQIYLDYINNELLSPEQIGKNYGLKKIATINILNKKCWKEATNDLPNIDLKERTRGEKWIHAKLCEQNVIDIVLKYASNNHTLRQLADEYKVSIGAITGIISGKNWKHVKR